MEIFIATETKVAKMCNIYNKNESIIIIMFV